MTDQSISNRKPVFAVPSLYLEHKFADVSTNRSPLSTWFISLLFSIYLLCKYIHECITLYSSSRRDWSLFYHVHMGTVNDKNLPGILERRKRRLWKPMQNHKPVKCNCEILWYSEPLIYYRPKQDSSWQPLAYIFHVPSLITPKPFWNYLISILLHSP